MASDDLRAEYESCRRRYPTIDLSYEDFFARVRATGIQVGHVCHEDLFLATACARGDRIAWEYFVDEYSPVLRRMAERGCRQFQEGEDLAQEMVAGLIADKSKLAGYNGRCSLAGWLRVALSHALIDRLRRRRREVSLEDSEGKEQELYAAIPSAEDRENSLDAAWGPVLAEALQAQIRDLPPRDRLIMSLYYVHGVPLKLIGRHFGVHEATASRWLDGLRRSVRKRVERDLRTRHRLKSGEISGLWQWVAEHELFRLADVLGSGCEVQTTPVTGASDSSSKDRT